MTADRLAANGWIASGLSTGGTASLDAPIRPIDDLAANDLGWLTQHVQPLQAVVDRMAGSASVIETFTTTWQKTATTLDAASEELIRAAGEQTVQWQGNAATGYRRWAAGQATSLGDTAMLATALATTSRTMAEVLAGARRSVGDLLGDLVQRLISAVPRTVVAEGGVTANVLTQATDLIGKYATPIAAIERGVDTTIAQVVPLLLALAPGGTQTRGAATTPDDDMLILAATPDSMLANPGLYGTSPTPSVPAWELIGPDAASRLPQQYSDYYDTAPADLQRQLRETLQTSSRHIASGDLLSDANTEAALRQGPDDTKPTISADGSGVTMAFRHSTTAQASLLRDIIVVDPAATGVNDAKVDLQVAMTKLTSSFVPEHVPRELWVQVPEGTTSESIYGLAQRANLDFRSGINAHFRDPSGQILDVITRMK